MGTETQVWVITSLVSVLRLLRTAASLWKSAACRGGGGSPASIRWRSSIVALCVTITVAHSLTVTDWLTHRRAAPHATLALPHVPAAHLGPARHASRSLATVESIVVSRTRTTIDSANSHGAVLYVFILFILYWHHRCTLYSIQSVPKIPPAAI